MKIQSGMLASLSVGITLALVLFGCVDKDRKIMQDQEIRISKTDKVLSANGSCHCGKITYKIDGPVVDRKSVV